MARDRQHRSATKWIIKTAVMRSIVQTRASHEDVKNAAQNQDEALTNYGEKKVRSTTDQVAADARQVSTTALRQSYVQFQALRDKRQASLPPQAMTLSDPETVVKPDVKAETVQRKAMEKKANGQLQRGMKQLKQKVIQQRAVQKHLQNRAEQGGKRAATITYAPLKTPVRSSWQAVTEQLRKAAAWLVQNVKQLTVSAIKLAVPTLVALGSIGAAIVIAVIFFAIVAVLFASPLGILFADQSSDPNAIPIREIVQETNFEFGQEINAIVDAHPECSEVNIRYDYEDGHTWASYWPEVLAIFAVDANLHADTDVIVIDAANRDRLNEIFWRMHRIDWVIEHIEADSDESASSSSSGSEDTPQSRDILHITVTSQSVEELAAELHFSDDEVSIVRQLLSDEMRPALLALCSGISNGIVQWPLPGKTYISCHFGETDAYGNPGHRGVDIPAPEGTPIWAAHSGTILISGWNDSYGNQVLLDVGAGTSTRYAHMTATEVSAGEAVSAGQIIGYVGSTGDSTGNHLHFEWCMDGILADPLTYVSPS